MRLISNFAELLHKTALPSPEECFEIEDGDEEFISIWLNNKKITCDLGKLFQWLETEYKLKSKLLTTGEEKIAKEVKRRFPVENWRTIKLFSEHQKKYRYYKKAVEDVKSRTSPNMSGETILTIFSPGWGPKP